MIRLIADPAVIDNPNQLAAYSTRWSGGVKWNLVRRMAIVGGQKRALFVPIPGDMTLEILPYSPVITSRNKNLANPRASPSLRIRKISLWRNKATKNNLSDRNGAGQANGLL